MLSPSSAFDLPARLAAKAEPALIGQDEAFFVALGQSMQEQIATLTGRLDVQRRLPVRDGQEALERDQEIHRLTARLRTLRRYGLDLCLGRIVTADEPEPRYIGRIGLTDSEGRRLLSDWRSPVAEPFFAATHAHPNGLTSRRRYHWTRGRVTDYWDEVFTPEGLIDNAALDDQSAFVASLGSSRSTQMRDVLSTIQADQDAIIRASSRGALVVDGGPGTGKTVVALHRSAYLLYADPRLGHRRGGLLFVGPHAPYLAYIADVLPSLGEEGVRTCTVRDMVPEGATASVEADPEVALLKASAQMVRAIEPAVRFYEEPPTEGMTVETHWSDIWLSPADWAAAFSAAEPGTSHNEARDQVWDELLAILMDKHADEAPDDELRRSLDQNRDLVEAFGRSWPLLEASDIVGDLWSVPAYLRMCAPWLRPAEVRKLQRPDEQGWTESDLPLLDAARQRVGDPLAARQRRRLRAARAAEREQMDRVVELLIEHDDTDMAVMSMLRGEDLRGALVEESPSPSGAFDLLVGPFAHVVVDEAQELTDAQWQMVLARCPSRSLTIVGDRAQARHGFAESWEQRLARIGLSEVTLSTLTINYRTPEEVMAQAAPIIREALPDANVPLSVRSTGVPVVHGPVSELRAILQGWLDAHADGIAAVIGSPGVEPPEFAGWLATSAFAGPLVTPAIASQAPGAVASESSGRVRYMTPELAKGLEFDLVVLIDPQGFGDGIEGAVDRYVAMTRATQQLVVLTSE